MSQVIPEKYRDLFQKRAFASLGTLMPDGRPQVTPVWCDFDGEHVIFNSAKGRQKDRNVRRDPRVSLAIIPFLVVAWVVVAGLYGIVTSRDLIHQIVCLIVVQSSTYVLLLGVGYVTGGAAPYFFDIPLHTKAVDPVVQALALTDVVVEAAVTALLLSFAIQAQKRFGTLDPHKLAEFKG